MRELFYATPARLKFLKSTRSEDLAIIDIVKRLAMARPDIGFTLTLDGRKSPGPRRRTGPDGWPPAAPGPHHGP